MRSTTLGLLVAAAAAGWSATAGASECDEPEPEWLMCEDFEQGGLGWEAWFAQSPFIECNGCSDGINDPNRIQLLEDGSAAHEGDWSLYMPAEAAAGYTGASLTYRHCDGDAQAGCPLIGHDDLYFRTWVRLAEDHLYVHHFLSVAGTQPDEYWGADGNAGCRPNGYRAAGTTLDFDQSHELFFYTYFPEMQCDTGGYCSGQYAQDICDGCAAKDMPCDNGLECCWGNHFLPDSPSVLPTGEWTCLEIHMHINTPGQDDGTMSFWVNDELQLEQTGMHWRDDENLQLNKAWLQHYIADGDAEQSNRVWFDDVVVSTERIGCTVGGGDGDGGGDGTDGSGDGDGDGGGTDGGGDGSGDDSGGTDGDGGSGGDGGGDSGSSEGAGESGGDGGSSGCGCSTTGTAGPIGLPLLCLVALRRRHRYRVDGSRP